MSMTLPSAKGITMVIALETKSNPMPPVNTKSLELCYNIKVSLLPANLYFSGLAKPISLRTSLDLIFGRATLATDSFDDLVA